MHDETGKIPKVSGIAGMVYSKPGLAEKNPSQASVPRINTGDTKQPPSPDSPGPQGPLSEQYPVSLFLRLVLGGNTTY